MNKNNDVIIVEDATVKKLDSCSNRCLFELKNTGCNYYVDHYVGSIEHDMLLSQMSFEKDIINPIDFINEEGEKVKIWWSKDVEESIGMPLRVILDQQGELNNKRYNIIKLNQEISSLKLEIKMEKENNKYIISQFKKDYDTIKNMNFWQRLKFLFTKKLPIMNFISNNYNTTVTVKCSE